ncbi:MAG: hypothetical protein AAF206_02410 [Bacteroidota bacterium]
MNLLPLDRMLNGLPAISPIFAAFLWEACLACLDHNDHLPKADLTILGDQEIEYQLISYEAIDDQLRNTWSDPTEATEYGATCLAVLLVLEVTDYTVVRRSVKGTGFDYWLGHASGDFPFQDTARLEISGILSGDMKALLRRVKAKKKQTERSDHLGLPALIIVSEFRNLIMYIAAK